MTKPKAGFNLGVTSYDSYSAGAATSDLAVKVEVVLAAPVQQLLVFPREDTWVELNDSAEAIMAPAGAWTIMSVLTEKFRVLGVTAAGDVYWQAWRL